jgi:tetratricopeptide (TPR) repeat protein
VPITPTAGITQSTPNNAVAYYNRGTAYWAKAGEVERAIADFTKAIELDPQYILAYTKLGNAYYRSPA